MLRSSLNQNNLINNIYDGQNKNSDSIKFNNCYNKLSALIFKFLTGSERSTEVKAWALRPIIIMTSIKSNGRFDKLEL